MLGEFLLKLSYLIAHNNFGWLRVVFHTHLYKTYLDGDGKVDYYKCVKCGEFISRWDLEPWMKVIKEDE